MTVYFVLLPKLNFNNQIKQCGDMQNPAVQPSKPPKQKQIAKPTQKIKKFQRIWRIMFLAVSLLMMVLANKMYLFHTMEQFTHHKKGNLVHLFLFSIPFAFLYIVTATDYLIHYIFDDWVNKNLLRQDRYKDEVSRNKKSRVVVRWGFNIFYYSLTSIAGYLLIKQTKFLPPFLGGHGSIYTLSTYRYLEDASFGMQVYLIVQFGKHVGRYFCHAFIQSQGNYYEYMLHHSLATFLILFSYAMDLWVLGIFVLVVHDCSDVFLALTRAYRQMRKRNSFVLNIGYTMTVITWMGLRIVSFGYCCVWGSWYSYYSDIHTLSPVEQEVFKLPYMFMCGMVSCLLLMHVYWTYFIIESFVGSAVNEKIASHSYD